MSRISPEKPIPIKSKRNFLYLLALSPYVLHLTVQIMREPSPTSSSVTEQQTRSDFDLPSHCGSTSRDKIAASMPIVYEGEDDHGRKEAKKNSGHKGGCRIAT